MSKTINQTSSRLKINNVTDENLITIFKDSKDKELKDLIFRTIIERSVDHEGKKKKSWHKKIQFRVNSFLHKSPLLAKDADADTLYSKILMNLFTAIKSYDPSKQFTHYFNGLITKTLQNELRNFLTKRKQIIVGDETVCHAYQVTDSLDDTISLQDGDVDRHEVIPDPYSLEENFDRKKVIDLILTKCTKYLNEIEFDIFLHDTITDQLSNKDLAKKYNCCCSRISGIKTKQIEPTLKKIRTEINNELGFCV